MGWYVSCGVLGLSFLFTMTEPRLTTKDLKFLTFRKNIGKMKIGGGLADKFNQLKKGEGKTT